MEEAIIRSVIMFNNEFDKELDDDLLAVCNDREEFLTKTIIKRVFLTEIAH